MINAAMIMGSLINFLTQVSQFILKYHQSREAMVIVKEDKPRISPEMGEAYKASMEGKSTLLLHSCTEILKPANPCRPCRACSK